jgi:tRNA (adenine37-N6)-methyltransferase
MMLAPIAMNPIGVVRCSVTEAVDDVFGGLQSRIEIDPDRFTADSLAGLEWFSNVEIVFVFHLVDESNVHTGARHPRGNTDWPKAGIFAQRAKNRPNRIGVTVCRLIAVESAAIVVESLDAVDGTPVLDIKPYMREFAPRDGDVEQPEWASDLMRGYWGK